MPTTATGGQYTTDVREVGWIRYKITFTVQAGTDSVVAPIDTLGISAGAGHTVASGPPTRDGDRRTPALQQRVNPAWAHTISNGVVAGVSTLIDALDADRFIAEPSARGFARALFVNGFNANLTVDNWLVLQVGADTEFCFFSVGANIAPDFLRRTVGATTASVSGNVTIAFGPSMAAWLAFASRLGPGFFAWAVRNVPAIARTGSATPAAAAASGLPLGPFATWLGPISWAIPIGIAIRDFSVWVCRGAYLRGYHRGQMIQVGTAFVRHVYGMRQRRVGSSALIERGANQARIALTRHSAESLRRYLERYFRDCRPVPTAHTQAGGFSEQDIDHLGFLFGESLFNVQEESR